MYVTVHHPCDRGAIPDHGGVFQGIFPWLIMCAALYTVQRAPKSGAAPFWIKSLQSHEEHEMPTDQPGLRISSVYSTRTKNA